MKLFTKDRGGALIIDPKIVVPSGAAIGVEPSLLPNNVGSQDRAGQSYRYHCKGLLRAGFAVGVKLESIILLFASRRV